MYFFRGITKFTVETKKQATVIDNLRKCVPLRNIKVISDEVIQFYCFYHDKLKVTELLSGMNSKVLSEKSFGLYHLLHKYRKRVGLFVAGFLVFACLMLSRFFVWEIRVEGNENIGSDEIVKTLEQVGFREGVLKKSVDLDSLVNNFLIKEKRVSWIAVNFDGSVAHVEIKEGENPPIHEKKENVNLVASHDGIIMRTDILEGGGVVCKGDVVYKGQLLVSAFIDRTGKSTMRGARGSVWASTERKITVHVPLRYEEKKFSDDRKTDIDIRMLGSEMHLGFVLLSDKTYSKSKKITDGLADGKYPLPFCVTQNTYRQYSTDVRRRTHKQALETARENAELLLYKNSPTFAITGKEENYDIENDIFVYTCVYSGIENIAVEKEFEIS